MTTAIVIPTFNRRATVLYALDKLFAVLPPGQQVIVVDSGSSDSTADDISFRFPRVVLVHGTAEMWWAAATNFGIRKAKQLGCTRVITYNDDNVATHDLIANLNHAACIAPKSIISAVCCYLDRPDTVFFAGRTRARGSDRFFYLDHDVPLRSVGQGLRQVDLLHGMCTLFPMAVFDRVGLFDEDRFPHVFADDDLLLRACRFGFPLKVALDAVVLNDRTKTGINPYNRRLGPIAVFQLLTSRKSTFQLTARTAFLFRHRRSARLFFKTLVFDYVRLFAVLTARWLLPFGVFHRIGIRWGQRRRKR